MPKLRHGLARLFQYETSKVLVIKSKKVGLVNLFLQICVLAYIVGYVLIFDGGYQTTGDIESATNTKVKGITVTNLTLDDFKIPDNDSLAVYNRVWDVAEYVIPPAESAAFFIMTNAIITPNQTQATCDESPDVKEALCGPSQPCPVGKELNLGNGKTTGRCINSTQRIGVQVCEVEAWCPVEKDELPLKNKKILIDGAVNYTVLIKNNIAFPSFGAYYRRNNIVVDTNNSSYLKSCRFHPENDPFCPVFRIGDIIDLAGQNFTEMAYKGAIMAIIIRWDCNLDWNFMKYCRPKYSFLRLDDRKSMISPGMNFRFSHEENYGRRTLYKALGIKFVVQTYGEGKKFDPVPTLLNIGAGLALLYICPMICDFVLLNCMRSRDRYKERKFEYIVGDDAFGVPREGYEVII